MNWEVLFPGKYLKSAEFGQVKPTYTVKAITVEDLPDEKTGGTRKRGIVAFQETEKALVLNRTNATALKAMFGAETNNWLGKRVCFFAAPFTDPFTGEQITAIRVVGSPDIHAPLEFTAKIGRKQVLFRLQRTGAAGNVRTGEAGTKQKPPNKYERIVMACLEYGKQTEEVGSIIKAATGRRNAKELEEEDVGKVVAYLENQKMPPPPAEDGELPIPEDEDVPF